MNAAATETRTETAGDRAALRTMSARRRRVWRNLTLFLVAMVVMVVLSLLQRDSQDVKGCRANLDFAVETFAREYQRLPFPRELPLPGDGESVRPHYRYTPQQVNQLQRQPSVGILYCTRPHNLFLHAEGRHLVLYDGKEFEVLWLEEPEFRERAAAVGLHLPLGG